MSRAAHQEPVTLIVPPGYYTRLLTTSLTQGVIPGLLLGVAQFATAIGFFPAGPGGTNPSRALARRVTRAAPGGVGSRNQGPGSEGPLGRSR